MKRFSVLMLLIVGLTAAGGATPLPTTAGSGKALEGDLVSVNGAAVKLWGIDAPDKGQTCQTRYGKEYDCFIKSRDSLASFIGQAQVTCHIRGADINGQKVGTCEVNGLDLAALQIRAGWAMSFHSLSPQYAKLEGYAQAGKKGFWSGSIEPPWAWRNHQTPKKK